MENKIEEIVIGQMLLSGEVARRVVAVIGEQYRAFSHGAARDLYRCIKTMVEAGEEISLLTVAERLREAGQLEHIAGAATLSKMAAQSGNAEEVETMAYLLLEAIPGEPNDCIYVDDLYDEVCRRLDGWQEPTYGLGFDGGLTDRRIRLTEDGGLWIMTGMPNSGKTAWLRCVLAQQMMSGRRVALLSFEEMNKAKQIVRLVQLISGNYQTQGMPIAERDRILSLINHRQVHLATRHHEATIEYILQLADREHEKQKLDFLVIDPYLYIEEDKTVQSETQRIKNLLKALRQWAETRRVWVIVVAHPRMLHKDETGEYETVDQYTISGSAHWANMADYVTCAKRVFIRRDPDKGSEVPSYTQVDVVKVRDQDICKTGRLYYLRAASGRYREMPDEMTCLRELNDLR